MPMGGLAVPMGGLAGNVPGRGKNSWHRTSRTSTDFSVRLVLNLGAALGACLGVTNLKDNCPDNQQVKCRVCWVSPTVCQQGWQSALLSLFRAISLAIFCRGFSPVCNLCTLSGLYNRTAQ